MYPVVHALLFLLTKSFKSYVEFLDLFGIYVCMYVFTYLEGERYGSSFIQANLLKMLPFLEYGCLLACFANRTKI